MVQALVTLDENTNRVLNTVKAKYMLKDKGKAITFLVNKYIETENDPEFRPEFIKRMQRISKEKTIYVGTMEDFDKRYNINEIRARLQAESGKKIGQIRASKSNAPFNHSKKIRRDHTESSSL